MGPGQDVMWEQGCLPLTFKVVLAPYDWILYDSVSHQPPRSPCGLAFVSLGISRACSSRLIYSLHK